MPATKHLLFRNRRVDSHPELPIDPDIEDVRRLRWPPHFHPYLMVCVFIGGCGGASARYAVAEALPAQPGHWPISTLLVNLLGAFTLGLLLETLARRGTDRGIRRILRLLIGTGFIGRFTTYSTFALDTHSLLSYNLTLALAYLATTLVGGLLLSALGIATAAAHHTRRSA